MQYRYSHQQSNNGRAEMNRTELEQAVKDAKETLSIAESALDVFDNAPENNRYESLDEAEARLEDILMGRAFLDCEGAGNRGSDTYRQEFIVGEDHYMATLKPEYNRHDKTYYYIDRHDFSVEKLVR